MNNYSQIFPFTARIDYHSLFRHLEVFIKIVETESITLAAQRLNLTPSATSRTLSQLEEKLGVMLFKRTTRTLHLTEAGQYLYERSLIIIGELEESLTKINNFQHFPQGELKITCSIAFAVSHLIRIIGEYKASNPEVNLRIDLNDHLINLNEEDFDIAVRITPKPPNNHVAKKICDIHWAYCGSKEYFDHHGIPKSLEELEQHTCLINPNIADRWNSINENQSFEFKQTIKMNSSIGLLHAAIQHQGIVCLPTYMLNQYITSGELIPIFLDNEPDYSQYSLYLLYHPSKFSLSKIHSFVEFFKKCITEQPFWDEWMHHKKPESNSGSLD